MKRKKTMKKVISAILCALLLLGLCACADGSPSGQRTLVDGAGREVAVPETVERIVCVGVGALRYTCYMQGAHLVAGVEDCEVEPVISRLYNFVNIETFRDLPVIGGNGKPNAEAIITAEPQVIVLSQSAGVDAQELQNKTGTPVVVIPGNDKLLDENTFETIRILGELYGKQERAQTLTKYLKDLEKDLKDRTSAIADSQKPTVYVGGVSYKGHHGFEGTEAGYGPLALIGAKNLADTTGQTGAFNIDAEQVLTWDPDVIFLDFNGMDLIRADYLKNPDFYNSLSAVKNGKVYSQISFRSNATNLETALADAYYAASVLYPEAFADVDLEAKISQIYMTLLGTDPSDSLKEAGYAFRPVTIGA